MGKWPLLPDHYIASELALCPLSPSLGHQGNTWTAPIWCHVQWLPRLSAERPPELLGLLPVSSPLTNCVADPQPQRPPHCSWAWLSLPTPAQDRTSFPSTISLRIFLTRSDNNWSWGSSAPNHSEVSFSELVKDLSAPITQQQSQSSLSFH